MLPETSIIAWTYGGNSSTMMTELDKLRQDRETLDLKIADTEKRERAVRLREAFKDLAENESIPLEEFVSRLLKNPRGPNFQIDKFLEHMESLIKGYLKINPGEH